MCSRLRWLSCTTSTSCAGASCPGERVDHYRRHRRVRHAGAGWATGARCAGALHGRRSVERGLPLADREGDRRWPASRACALLRVNYVGELGWELHVPDGRNARGVRRPDGGGEHARDRTFRYVRDERAADGEGLSRLGLGTDQRDRLFEAGMERFVVSTSPISSDGRRASR